MLLTSAGSNPLPPGLQSDAHPTEPPRPAVVVGLYSNFININNINCRSSSTSIIIVILIIIITNLIISIFITFIFTVTIIMFHHIIGVCGLCSF